MEPIPTEEEDAVFNIDSTSYDSDPSAESYDDASHSDEEEFHDEEEAANRGTSGRRLQSMGIMMGEEFIDEHRNQNCCGRFWYCWLCGTVVFVSLFLVLLGALQYQKSAALLYGKDPLYGDYETEECQVYSKETLKLIEDHLTTSNDTKTFCTKDHLDNCHCKHPFKADKPDNAISQWAEIATMNHALVEKYTKHATADVALLGDSIVEHFNGLDLGYTGGKWKANKRVMDKVFDRQNGGKVNGVALGIGGDRIQNLLYRLQNGEAPIEFHPKVWWILIGTNDLVDNCNADTIAIGNFRIVEEIRKYHPGAIIVLNSILPRNENPENLLESPFWPIIQEINLKLECYSNTAKNVEFFNATDLFTHKRRGKVVVNDLFMKDPVHPNAEGSRLWGEAIADRVVELKSKKHHFDLKKKHNGHH